MMMLITLLPCLVGAFVDEEDDHWSCFLSLWDICSMASSYGATIDDAHRLAWLVQTYLESFKDLYGDKYITPKMHHLVHLPEQIIM